MSRGRDETGGWDSAKAGAAASSSPKAPPLGGGRRSSLSKAASADDILRTSVSGSPEVSSQGSPNASRNRSMSEGNGRGSTDHSPTTGRRISRDSAFQHRHSLRSSMLGRGGNSPSRKSESEEFDGSDIESSIGYSSLDDLDNSRMQDFVSDPEFKDKDGQMDYKPDALVKSEYTKWVDDNSENKDFEEQFAIYQNKLNIANEQFQVILNGLLQSFEKRLSKATKGIIPGITAGNPKESELGPLKSKKAFKNLMREFAGLDNDSGLVEVALGDLKRGWQNYTVGGSSGYDIMSQVFELYKDYGQLKKYGELKTDAEIKKLQKDSSRNEYPEEKKIDLGGLPPYLVNKFQDYAFRAFKVSVESMRSSRKASLGVKGKGLLGIIREGADLARESYEKFKIENDYLLNHVAKRQVEAVRTYKSVGKSDESLNIAICEPALEPFESKVIPDLKIPGSMHFEGMLLSRDQLEALRDIDRAFANYNGGTESGGLRGKVEIRLPTGTGKSHLSRLLKDIYSTKIEEIGSVDLNSTERDMTRLLRVSKQDLSLSEVRGHNQAGLEHKKAQYVSIDESFFFARYFREKFLPEDLVEKDFKKYDDKDFAALEKGRVEFLRGLRRNGVVAITWGASEEPLKVRFEILRNKDKFL